MSGPGIHREPVSASYRGTTARSKSAGFGRGDFGTGHATGIWEDTPTDRPEFKARYAKLQAAAAKAEEHVGT